MKCAVFWVAVALAASTAFAQTSSGDKWRLYYGDDDTRSAVSPVKPQGSQTAPLGLKVQVFLYATKESAPRPVPVTRIFREGEYVKLQVESNAKGHLYIWQEGASGKSGYLFPHAQINEGRNDVQQWQKITIPAEGFWRIAGPPGTDELSVSICREPIPALKTAPPTLLAFHQAIPAEKRDFELVPDRPERPAAAGGQPAKPEASLMVNVNLNRNGCVYRDITIRHQ